MTWLFIGPTLLAGIGQVTRRYIDLLCDGEYVEFNKKSNKEYYDNGFAFILPIQSILDSVDEHAKKCKNMIYMTICETSEVNPDYGILTKYKILYCPSQF